MERYRLKCGRESAMKYLLGIAKAVNPKALPSPLSAEEYKELRAQMRDRELKEREQRFERQQLLQQPSEVPPVGLTHEPYEQRPPVRPGLRYRWGERPQNPELATVNHPFFRSRR